LRKKQEREGKLGKITLEKLRDKLSSSIKQGKSIKLVLAIITMLLLTVILSGLIIVGVSSLYQTSSTISSVGTFKAIGIGVYWDEALASRVDTINWGALEPGTQKSFTIYIRNEGNIPLTLSISTSNWNPAAVSNYLTLTWSYGGQVINVATTAAVTLTLAVSESITGIYSFGFDITAVGSG
jgi:hypothetical protein